MMIHEITKDAGRHKRRKRIGRGVGSGRGKTSGRGHKGFGSRSGNSNPHEGGQIPFYARFPKRGFSNAKFKMTFQVVNLNALDGRFNDGETVDAESLAKAGLTRRTGGPIKVLAFGELGKKLTVVADAVSGSAREKIEAAGGSVSLVEGATPSSTKKKRVGRKHHGAAKGKPGASKSAEAESAEAKAAAPAAE